MLIDIVGEYEVDGIGVRVWIYFLKNIDMRVDNECEALI